MDPSERWQAIAPASDEPGEQHSASANRKRRQAVAVACVQCRSGKAKCNGLRPRCTRCIDSDLTCQYDVAEGVSRAERMKLLKRDGLAGRYEGMERVINALRSGSDSQAVTLLARLRLGERVDEVAKTLPATATLMPVSTAPSLHTQGSPGASASVLSQELIHPSSEYTSPSTLRHNSSVPYTSLSEHRPSWPGPSSTASALRSSGKGKQPTAPNGDDVIEDPPFLSLLFDRQDFLLSISESEDDDPSDTDTDKTLDPRLLFEGGINSVGSPMDMSSSRMPSPEKKEFGRSIHVTHLRSRQPIGNTVKIHHNLNPHNLFGNLPFSSSIRANNYPVDVQDTQLNNLFLPTWAMMTVSTIPDPGSVKLAFPAVFQDATALLESGTPVALVMEAHPNIAALFDEGAFNTSGILSRWAAGMVHSLMLKGNDFTCFAYMYLLWYVIRWMISPSPDTYDLIPEWLRPTPNQLFMPHIRMIDFVPWPAFRELAVQIPAMQERMEWLMDMSNTLRCDWSLPLEKAFRRVDETGLLDLCPLAKTSLRDLSNWSLGPSFRGYVSNADSYVRIRVDEF